MGCDSGFVGCAQRYYSGFAKPCHDKPVISVKVLIVYSNIEREDRLNLSQMDHVSVQLYR